MGKNINILTKDFKETKTISVHGVVMFPQLEKDKLEYAEISIEQGNINSIKREEAIIKQR